jgi:hypothetical protein
MKNVTELAPTWYIYINQGGKSDVGLKVLKQIRMMENVNISWDISCRIQNAV